MLEGSRAHTSQRNRPNIDINTMWELLIKKEIPATNNSGVRQKSEKQTAVAKERQYKKKEKWQWQDPNANVNSNILTIHVY